MEYFLPIAEVYVNLPLIFILSLFVGVLSGLFGVGGGFLMTPFLIFLGIPPSYAVANEANNILGTSVSGSTTHYLKGTLDAAIMGIGGAFILVPAMIYIIGMPTKLVPGTSLFVTIFVSAIVTVLHAFYYGSIDLMLVMVLILGSILGVQVGQKFGERFDSSQFKTILAILLLLVGVAIAYDAFFAEKTIKIISETNGTQSLSVFAKFIKDISINVPVLYGIFSIGLALVLGVGAAIIRKFISDARKKYKQAIKS